MSFSPIPQYSFRELNDISPGFLNQLGIRFLMLDLDNTIAAYGESQPSDRVLKWVAEIKGCGIVLFIVSNSLRRKRIGAFAEALGLGVVMNAANHRRNPC